MCERCKLLGEIVLLKSGMKGQVVALDFNGNIEVSNELENNEYSYWVKAKEVREILTPIHL